MELQIQNISKTYAGGTRALNNVSLTIQPGMFGLLGPNGAGKSTLMRTIATLQEADSGTIRLGGIDVLGQKHETRKVLGYLPQEFGVYPHVSAEELLDHFAMLKGITNRSQRRDLVRRLLQQTNLYDHRKKKLGGFSGGMRQRFGIATVLLGDPKLIIVDEPTAGLDPEERTRFHNLLSEIGEQVVVILSTHIVDDVSDLCRDMAIINKGEVIFADQPFHAILMLQGKIWKDIIKKHELADYQAAYHVISSRLFAGETQVTVYSETQPGPTFHAAEPTLEDVYFWAINQSKEEV
ncbi:ABC transporter, ATP-binding protein [Candidatus Moduliflexus flocculans]|uniref:ABC transporter, ATP-binding protein n=1 Tax=Candidatus Moduliflexus flocculans TaxID=1499966 RepID=A0A0S6W128_9BACT|nr:ABC transporter, ATP-binding protein [Candidatus Moduliflexus flocculans]